MIRHNSKTIAIALLLLLPALLFGGVRATGSSLISTMPIHRFLQLDGSTQYAYIADSAPLQFGTDDLGGSGWFKTSANYSSAPGMILNKRTGNVWIDVSINLTNKLGISASDGVRTCAVESTITVNDGLWHFYFYVIDRDAGIIYLYLNGAYNNKSSALIVGSITTASQLHIGKQSTGALRYFNGQLDDIRIYKFGVNGLYVTGTFGSSGIIRVGTSTGDLIWSDTDTSNSLIYKLYDKPYATLTQLGFPSIDNANQTEVVTNGTFETGDFTGWAEGSAGGSADQNAVHADYKYSGSYGARVMGNADGTTNAPYIYQRNASALVTGKWYAYSVWAKLTDATSQNDYVRIGNNTTSTGYEYTSRAISSTTWTNFTGIFLATGTGLNIVVRQFANPVNGTTAIWVGGISIKEIGEVARWKLDTDLLDTDINGLNLTGVGSPTYGKAGLRAQ